MFNISDCTFMDLGEGEVFMAWPERPFAEQVANCFSEHSVVPTSAEQWMTEAVGYADQAMMRARQGDDESALRILRLAAGCTDEALRLQVAVKDES